MCLKIKATQFTRLRTLLHTREAIGRRVKSIPILDGWPYLGISPSLDLALPSRIRWQYRLSLWDEILRQITTSGAKPSHSHHIIHSSILAASVMLKLNSPPLTIAAWLRFDAIYRGLAQAKPRRILEVGTGQGAMGWRLARRFEYVGLEPDIASHKIASRRLARLDDCRVIAGTTSELDGDDLYDLVCAFEVLEHISDDIRELRRWRRHLRPGGHVLLSVPAHPNRFGPADEAVGHFRRYDRLDLDRHLRQAGFVPQWIEAWGGGLGHFLEWVRNMMASRATSVSAAEATARSGRWFQPKSTVVGWITAAVAAPFRLLQHPLRHGETGIGWVALARSGARNSSHT